MLAHERSHKHSNSRRRGRDHARSPARESDHHGDSDRCVKSDPRVDAGDNRDAYRLGNERKRNDNPGEDASARRSHTAAPFLAVTGNMFGPRNRDSATRYTARERGGAMNVAEGTGR